MPNDDRRVNIKREQRGLSLAHPSLAHPGPGYSVTRFGGRDEEICVYEYVSSNRSISFTR